MRGLKAQRARERTLGFLGLIAGFVGIIWAGTKLSVSWEIGDVDPLGATIGAASLLLSGASLYLSVRALRTPAPTMEEAADWLAGEVTSRERVARRQLLGDHDKSIDIAFELRPAPTHPVTGAGSHAGLTEIVGYYRRLSPRRMVITGAPGAGKTVMAVKLILGLLAARTPGQAVPVRISAASLNTDLEQTDAVEQWLRRHLMEVYRLQQVTADALAKNRLVVPVIDGLDEMDAGESPAYDSRAARVLRAVNAYQDQYANAKGAVILTCRTAQYEALEDLRVWAHEAARVEITPVKVTQARSFLSKRSDSPERWEAVLAHIERHSHGVLALSLSTPWRLTLAARVYDQRDPRDPSGPFLRNPSDLIEVATSTEAVRDHLLGLLIPASVSLIPPPGGADAERVHRWLAVLAAYLDRNAKERRIIGGRSLSGTDIVLHELWPLAGNRPRILAAGIIPIFLTAALIPEPMMYLIDTIPFFGILALSSYYSVKWSYANAWPEPQQIDLARLQTPQGPMPLS